MKKTFKISLITLAVLLSAGLLFIFTYVPPVPEAQGVVDAKLYLGDADQQPLFVAFGGGGGGNDWARNYLKGKRDTLNSKGYAVLAIGYFKAGDAPAHLDRISLDAISDTIVRIAQHPKIDARKIVLFGGSRGGELVLNLASRFDHFNGVIAASTSHVSFPAITWSANTASWTYRNEDVPYVPAPFKTITPALKGDLYTAHSMMLEDKAAVAKAEIAVEHISGPILLLSGEKDDQWPATAMSNRIMQRLEEHRFAHFNEHIVLDGGHIAPLERFELVYDFLETHFPPGSKRAE